MDGQQQVGVLAVGPLRPLGGVGGDVVPVPGGHRYVVGVGVQPAQQRLGGGGGHVPLHHHAGGAGVIPAVAGVHRDGVGRVPHLGAEQLVRLLQGALFLKGLLTGLPLDECLPQPCQPHRRREGQGDQLPVDPAVFSVF